MWCPARRRDDFGFWILDFGFESNPNPKSKIPIRRALSDESSLTLYIHYGASWHRRPKLHRMKKTFLALLLAVPAGAQEAPDLRKALDVLSRLKVTGYVQAQYVHNERSVDETTGGGTRNLDQFSVR